LATIEAPAGAAAATAAPLLEVQDLSITFATPGGDVPAVRGVDLALQPGQIMGLVGESGSGKSVTCQALLGLLPETAAICGRLHVAGRGVSPVDRRTLATLRGQTLAMVFQDPMSALDPLKSVRGHLRQRLRRHGRLPADRRRADATMAGLLQDVGVADVDRVLRAHPHQLSGGLAQRVVIALALAGEPQLLVADEPTTALDVTIQAQVLDLLAGLRDRAGLAVVLVTHDLGVVAETCDRIAVMYAGEIVETGPAEAVLADPAHPYTTALLAALPQVEGPRRPLVPVPGTVPQPTALPAGCTFAPRCRWARAVCGEGPVPLRRRRGRAVRCLFPLGEIGDG
jgi:peptide/nickel transport system ATP-binding protein